MSAKSIMTSVHALLLATQILAAATTSAIAGDTRGYIPAPPGTTGVLFYYRNISGSEKYKNGDKIADDFNTQTNLEIIRPMYYSSIASMPVTIQAIFPFGNMTLDGKSVGNKSYSTSGFADPIILASVWLINNPGEKTWLGISGMITFPIGEYDKGRVLNPGTNQWVFETELGFIKGWGNFYLELVPTIQFYTDNNDFTSRDKTLKKDPYFVMDTHLSCDVSKTVLVSLDHYYKKGGETSVDHIALNDETNTHSLQLTLGLRIAPKQQILLQYLHDLSVENGPKINTFGVRYTYIF